MFGIGDYDPDSISNYIANRRDQENGKMSQLSEGDIQSLLALYHRVQTSEHGAVYSIAQPMFGQDTLINEDAKIIADSDGRYQVFFSVPKTPYYRFKYGPLGNIDCRSEQGYSEVLDGVNMTKVDVTELAAGAIFKICVVGGASRTIDESYWQNRLAASQLIIEKAD